ncbi:hypothetical protein DB30_01794 [Enhygromyxa salina]|uniref:Uncharacterized protein n=1 Tax=Enhygromyxa salina TaxID=215803 RepID=A0A0C2CLY3_9BACT|nr:hypothetical protein DB30_01794 [Enhygromyxa salina]
MASASRRPGRDPGRIGQAPAPPSAESHPNIRRNHPSPLRRGPHMRPRTNGPEGSEAKSLKLWGVLGTA